MRTRTLQLLEIACLAPELKRPRNHRQGLVRNSITCLCIGVGLGRTPHRWLRPGETIITEIQGIGQLINPVVTEA
jgi:hypothetical protein